jgi:hypothetical protein
MYIIAANIRSAKEGYVVDLFLFENPNAIIPDETKRELHSNMEQGFQSKKLARRFPAQQIPEKRFCEANRKIDFHSPIELMNSYGLKLVKLIIVHAQHTNDVTFTLNLRHLLAEAELDLEGLEGFDCLLDLSQELHEFFDTVNRQ